MIMGFVAPTAGKISLFGMEPKNIETKKQIGFLPERPYFYMHLTGKELLTYFGKLSGMKGDHLRTMIDNSLKKVGLSDAAGMKLSAYSKGMLQRAGIAQAIMHDPKLVIFDEPMSGLDPAGRKEVKDIIKELKREGKTVLFSSHILGDIEDLSDKILIIEKGEVRNFGRIDEIIEKDDIHYRIEFRCSKCDENVVFQLFPGVKSNNGIYSIILKNIDEMNAVVGEIVKKNYTLHEAGVVYPSLEELIFKTGEKKNG